MVLFTVCISFQDLKIVIGISELFKSGDKENTLKKSNPIHRLSVEVSTIVLDGCIRKMPIGFFDSDLDEYMWNNG